MSPVPIWKVARATSAAPLYFDAAGPFVDGGLIANNPATDILTEIAEFNTALGARGDLESCVQPEIMVSLGTASQPVRKARKFDFGVGN